MKKEYILFIDSGLGGLSTLAETYKIVSSNFIYFADNKNHPYGKHTKNEIFEFVKNIIEKLQKKYYFRIVVLACNTATTSSIEKLRRQFDDLCFVGTEPAIRPATSMNFENIFVLATPATAKQQKYKRLRQSFGKKMIKTKAIFSLASNIERHFLHKTPRNSLNLQRNLYEIKSAASKSDAIILGCTHYCLIQNELETVISKPLISGNKGVAKRVFAMQKVLQSVNFKPQNKNHVVFVFSARTKFLKQKYIKIFSQILANN